MENPLNKMENKIIKYKLSTKGSVLLFSVFKRRYSHYIAKKS